MHSGLSTADGSAIELIDSSAAFAALDSELAACKHIALDTEFMRTNTFYPLLGLLQIADHRGCYLVDPLPMQDSRLLGEFLRSPNHTLVLHSCSEDLNLMYTALDAVPAAVFDTQLAAAFLGLGFSLSYQALVHDILGIDIPKDETRSDWLQRPLTDTQKIYAATDVLHLLELRDLMEAQLKAKGIFSWFEEECRDLLVVAPQSELADNWQFSYANINNAWRLHDLGLKHLQKLCVWREQEARRRNKPRSWIAKDADLMLIAAGLANGVAVNGTAPDLAALSALEGVDKHILNRYGSELGKLLASASTPTMTIDRELLNNPLSAHSRNKLKACQRIVQELAQDLTIAPELIGRKKIIVELVKEYAQEGAVEWPATISGWRRALLEPALTPILTS